MKNTEAVLHTQWPPAPPERQKAARKSQDAARVNEASGLSGVIPNITKSLKCEEV